jgi:cell wall-associated NlpC family hydrolase
MALTSAVLSPVPAQAEPDATSVRARVNALLHDAEIASERYNDASIALKAAKQRLALLQADLEDQRQRFDEVRSEVAALVVSQYQGQTLSSTAQVLFSDNPDDFLAQLTVLVEYTDEQNGSMGTFLARSRELALREKAASAELEAIRAAEQELADNKAAIDEKSAEAQELLAQLTSVRVVAPSRTTVRLPNVSASGRAKVAVDFALSQIGDVYSYGATGMSAWDCSGLTMVAWGQAGVSLPHSSAAQASYGRPVSASELQPGDLVFYYSPISHVAIYIGNGTIVHAARPGEGVRLSDLYAMPFTGAVRLG